MAEKEIMRSEQTERAPERVEQRPVLTPAVDIFENDEQLLLVVDMPGVNKDDLNITLQNGELSLEGRRSNGAGDWSYARSFRVSEAIDGNKISANLEQGVLHLKLPKAESQKPRRIQVKGS